MKSTTGRIYFYPNPVKPEAPPKAFYKRKALFTLTPSELWVILEWIEKVLRGDLFYPKSFIKGLKKRRGILMRELDERIKDDEWMCKFWGPSFRDGTLIDNYGWDQNEFLNSAIDACRKSEGMNRKSLCKVPIGPASGFKRPKKDPDPRNRIRVDRSKIKKY